MSCYQASLRPSFTSALEMRKCNGYDERTRTMDDLKRDCPKRLSQTRTRMSRGPGYYELYRFVYPVEEREVE
mgnify:FL=1|jgi:hypothetical protein